MTLYQIFQMAWCSQRLMRSQWWPRAKLGSHQRVRLRRLLQSAYRDVPFYAKLYRKQPTELEELPIIEKSDLQAADISEQLSSRANPSELQRMSTSGSTGQPLSVHFRPAEFVAAHRASFARFYRLYGRRLNDVVAYFGPGRSLTSAKRSLLSRIIPHRFIHIDSFAPIDEQIDALCSIQPGVITGYTSTLERIARAVIDRGIESVRPHLVYTGAETLTPRTRPLVRQAFDTDLRDTYNCIEVGNIAWECPSGSGLYHVNDDALVVEVVDAAGQHVEHGSVGDIVITSLTNFTQPLIRYRIGDMVRLAARSCSCGRSLTTLETISGRKAESLELPDGRLITPLYFWRLFRDCHAIRQFQVVQKSATELILRIVRDVEDADVEAERQELERDLKFFKVRLEYVDQVEMPSNGKVRTFIPLPSSQTKTNYSHSPP